ncbi:MULTISPECIES: TfuA-like protein [unclassified Rhizobium]|uniref:TfuA-like protein n=1 Tax=unclassified Rhizobium TaxID=2613769 RepID=UPI0021F7E584|nr:MULTISPECIES: TfuA-like protein [unclassified Rhizobium]MCV9947671.1 TfuA-like protein [Rhizobium sp. BT-175]MCW0020468.1 TfuA-like protein [Rhizobium sp. BT-226]
MGYEIVVFLGPTMSVADAREHLDALYLTPAGNGDIVRAVIEHDPSAIALIDGVFGQSPAVRHKEILWAMSRGVRVYGASSMGAVRAAELTEYGMSGYGMVFRWYRRTSLADDADVAVAMAPAQLGSFPLGDALIDIRLTLKRALRDRIIGRQLQVALERLARSIHYTERSFGKLISVAAEHGMSSQELRALDLWLVGGKRKQKKADAIGLLALLSSDSFETKKRSEPRSFELTEAFAYDMEYYNFADILLDPAHH